MIKRVILLASLAAAFAVASTSAFADSISWSLSNNCSGSSCASVGIVTATDTPTGVNVSVVLTSGYFSSNGSSPTFSFSLDPSLVPADATITNVVFTNSDGTESYNSATVSQPPLGTDDVKNSGNQGDNNVMIDCPACAKNPLSGTLTTLTFIINGVSINDFASTSGSNIKDAPWYFEANTGNAVVWAWGDGARIPAVPAGPPSDPPAVPEPSTLLFLGTGLTALGGILRRKLIR